MLKNDNWELECLLLELKTSAELMNLLDERCYEKPEMDYMNHIECYDFARNYKGNQAMSYTILMNLKNIINKLENLMEKGKERQL